MSALRWFDATHDVEIGLGAARWRRIGLPGPGNIGEQDARLMEALDLLLWVHRDLMAKQHVKPSDGEN